MVHVWREDWNDPTDVAVTNAELLIGIPLSAGDSLAGRFPDGLRLQVNSSHVADFFYAGSLFVISDHLRRLFLDFSVEAECFKLEMEGMALSSEREYYCANILRTIDCFDWEFAEYLPEKDFATKIKRLCLVDDMISESVPLFRVARTIPSIVCVCDKLKDVVQEIGLTGMEFVTPEGWTNPTLF